MAALLIRGQEIFSLLALKNDKKINSEQLEKLCILHGAKKNDNSQKTMEELASSSLLDEQIDITHLIHPTPLSFECMDLLFGISGAEWSTHRSILNNALNDIHQMSNVYLMTMILSLFEKHTGGITSETNSFYDLIIEKTNNIVYVKDLPDYARNILMGLLTNVGTIAKSRKKEYKYNESTEDVNDEPYVDEEYNSDEENEMEDAMADAYNPASKLQIRERHRKRQRRHLLQQCKAESKPVRAYRKREMQDGLPKQNIYNGNSKGSSILTGGGKGLQMNIAPGVLCSEEWHWSAVNKHNYRRMVKDKESTSIFKQYGQELHNIVTNKITMEVSDAMIKTNCVRRIIMITEVIDFMIRCQMVYGLCPVWLNNNEPECGLKPLGPNVTFEECERPINYGLASSDNTKSNMTATMARTLQEEEDAVGRLFGIIKEASKYTVAKSTAPGNSDVYMELHAGLGGNKKDAEQRQKQRQKELEEVIEGVLSCFEKAINNQPPMKIGEMGTDMMITMCGGKYKISTTHSYFSSHK